MTDGQPPGFRHILRLSDSTGLFEHARGSIPRRSHGYCTDDVARGLLVASREPDPAAEITAVAERYLAFLSHAQGPDGTFRNRLGHDRRWEDEPGLGDWWGRALWGLGTAAVRSATPWIRAEALTAFAAGVGHRSPYPRAMAFAGLGAAEVVRAGTGPIKDAAAELLAAAAEAVGLPGGDAAWPWPERRLTYANAALAEVLIVAGELLGDARRLAAGLAMLGWLREVQDVDGRLSVIAVGGYERGQPRARHDQQSIEVAALADACAAAALATGDRGWTDGVRSCAAWFRGANDAGVPMWDPATGGGYDGLTPDGPNLNQGAESTLALIATFQQDRSVR